MGDSKAAVTFLGRTLGQRLAWMELQAASHDMGRHMNRRRVSDMHKPVKTAKFAGIIQMQLVSLESLQC